MYVSPLFDLLKLTNFADDNFIIRWNKCMTALIKDLEKDLEIMTKWLRDSGLKVNEEKTELCLFHRYDHHPIFISLNGKKIQSQNKMNVLGVTFDSKLQWGDHISQTIKKANIALHAIRLIKSYFTPTELRTLITSNFYSVLFYNAEIWLLPKLNRILKANLLSSSANALKICTPYFDYKMSFDFLHTINKRATPHKYMLYKHAIELHKLFNLQQPPLDWISLNFDQTTSRRQTHFTTSSTNNFKIGNNILSNRLSVLNNIINLEWLNLSINSFKIKCKKLLL